MDKVLQGLNDAKEIKRMVEELHLRAVLHQGNYQDGLNEVLHGLCEALAKYGEAIIINIQALEEHLNEENRTRMQFEEAGLGLGGES